MPFSASFLVLLDSAAYSCLFINCVRGSSRLWTCRPTTKVPPSLRWLFWWLRRINHFYLHVCTCSVFHVLFTCPSFCYWFHVLYTRHVDMRYETDLSPRSNAVQIIPFHQSQPHVQLVNTSDYSTNLIRSRIQYIIPCSNGMLLAGEQSVQDAWRRFLPGPGSGSVLWLEILIDFF